jgi:hypothetical protein
MPGPSLPADDLYARLELPGDASPEAIEIAWRSLLRRHHPDVAGPDGLEHAKRINVAHDWLSDPHLRARYDRQRGVRRTGRGRTTAWHDRVARERPDTTRPPRPIRPEDVVARFLEHVAGLTADELDRLAVADPAPIAFGATIRRFVPEERRLALEALEREVARRLPSAATARHGVEDTIRAYAAELVLGPFLDQLLSEPFRERTRERLCRGWEAAVDQPRYGPNGDAVRALIERLRRLDANGVARLAQTGAANLGDDPWPPGTSPDDDEGLRVSSAVAGSDAAQAVPAAGQATAVHRRARRAAARIAHLLVLRHAFAPATFDALTSPWRPSLVPVEPPAPRVRRPEPA